MMVVYIRMVIDYYISEAITQRVNLTGVTFGTYANVYIQCCAATVHVNVARSFGVYIVWLHTVVLHLSWSCPRPFSQLQNSFSMKVVISLVWKCELAPYRDTVWVNYVFGIFCNPLQQSGA